MFNEPNPFSSFWSCYNPRCASPFRDKRLETIYTFVHSLGTSIGTPLVVGVTSIGKFRVSFLVNAHLKTEQSETLIR